MAYTNCVIHKTLVIEKRMKISYKCQRNVEEYRLPGNCQQKSL